jgi:PPM family protein phosphatase
MMVCTDTLLGGENPTNAGFTNRTSCSGLARNDGPGAGGVTVGAHVHEGTVRVRAWLSRVPLGTSRTTTGRKRMDTTRLTRPAAATHVGRVRKNNEDAYAVGDGFWIVADGLGGHVGGEVASGLAVDAAREYLELAGLGRTPALSEVLAAFRVANWAIHAGARDEPNLEGMGTTLVVAALNPYGTLIVGNVGDSRAYLLVGGGLHQLTTDDNLAQELVASGALTLEAARTHPGQFVLTKALGLGQRTAPKATIRTVQRAQGRLLLCTDGLSGELDDSRIGALLDEGTPEEAAADLVAAALECGGRDNVTVIVVDL